MKRQRQRGHPPPTPLQLPPQLQTPIQRRLLVPTKSCQCPRSFSRSQAQSQPHEHRLHRQQQQQHQQGLVRGYTSSSTSWWWLVKRENNGHKRLGCRLSWLVSLVAILVPFRLTAMGFTTIPTSSSMSISRRIRMVAPTHHPRRKTIDLDPAMNHYYRLHTCSSKYFGTFSIQSPIPSSTLSLSMRNRRRNDDYYYYDDEDDEDAYYDDDLRAPTRREREGVSVGTRVVGRSRAERELKDMMPEMEDEDETEDDNDDVYVEDEGYEYDADDEYEEEEEEYDSRQRRRGGDVRRSRNRRRRTVGFDSNEDDDYDYDYGEERRAGGNFWFNPLGGLDAYPPSSSREGDGRRRRRRALDSSKNRVRSRTTFRSGAPPAPNVVKDFYDRLFWYGFDPSETTSAADRTMFGGTKGKFNGLGLLRDSRKNSYKDYDDYDDDDDYDSNDRGRRYRNKNKKRIDYDDDFYDDYDDNYYEEDEDDYNYQNRMNANENKYRYLPKEDDEEFEYEEVIDFDDDDDYKNDIVVVVPEDKDYDIDDRDGFSDNGKKEISVPNAGVRNNVAPPLPPSRVSKDTDMDVDVDSDSDGASPRYRDRDRDLWSDSQNPPPPSETYRPSFVKTERRTSATSFSSDGRRRKKQIETSSWFNDDDDDDDDDYESNPRSRTKRTKKSDPTSSPIVNILDKVFQVNSEEVNYRAEDYNRKLGLSGRRRNGSSSVGSASGRRQRAQGAEMRRRKGYAYPYVREERVAGDVVTSESVAAAAAADDDDEVDRGADSTTDKDLGIQDQKGEAQSTKDDSSAVSKTEGDVIDVEATVQSLSASAGSSSVKGKTSRQDLPQPQRQQQQRRRKQQSWKDRSQATERVPPSGVAAWGPDGEVGGGIDVRTQAAMSAIEEIKESKRVLGLKEQRVLDVEEDLILLKRDSVKQKQRLMSRQGSSRSPVIRERLRMINEEIEDAARALRRARREVQSALDLVEELEDRHWALLSQHEADEELKQKRSSSKEDEGTNTSSDES